MKLVLLPYVILKKKKSKILAAVGSSQCKRTLGRKTLHQPRDATFDRCLYAWFSKQRKEGVPVSGPLLIARAKILKEEMKITSDITFSQGWLRSFKQRHGIRQLSISGEKRSADADAATVFKNTFANVMKENELTPDQIYNCDETGLNWKCLPSKALAANEEATATGFKKNKERVTVLTCANASGKHKLKLLVIGKSKNPRALKGTRNLPVTYRSQPNAWMNKNIFKEWFLNEFVPAVQKNLQAVGKPRAKCVLLLDNCAAHPEETELVSDDGNIFACYFPPNVTALIQPMDQGVIQSLKCFYKRNFMLQMIHGDTHPGEFQRCFTIKHALYAIASAWNTVKCETLSNAWHQLLHGIKSMNEAYHEHNNSVKSQDKELINESFHLATSSGAFADIEREDVEKWMEDIDEIIHSAPKNYENIECLPNPDSSESNLTDNECKGKTTWNEAESYIDKVIEFMEMTPCFNGDDTLQAYNLKTTLLSRKTRNAKLDEVRQSLKKGIQESFDFTDNDREA